MGLKENMVDAGRGFIVISEQKKFGMFFMSQNM